MRIRITPFRAEGCTAVPSSKSELHRLLIAAALSDRPTLIRCRGISDDVAATVDCLKALGAGIKNQVDGLLVEPIKKAAVIGSAALNCRESGSTFRFLLPVAAALGGASFTGSGRLPSRPVVDLVKAMKEHGAAFSADQLPFTVTGPLAGGTFELPGNVSSQYMTGLMLAAPLMGETRIRILGQLQSIHYVQMTADVMSRFGVSVSISSDSIVIGKGQTYQSSGTVDAEGDWSAAAFPVGLGALGGPVTVEGLRLKSIQGDSGILEIMEAAGARIESGEHSATVTGKPVAGLTLDVSDIPDLVPVLAAVFMHAKGETVFSHAERLRLKESDRLQTTCDMVNALGGQASIVGDSLCIRGSDHCSGGTVNGAGDHRIVMAAFVGASACKGASVIEGAEAVKKSWPSFFEDMKRIGGVFDVIDVR